MFDDDDAALDIAADVLANGKTSRLYRALVHEARLAIDVSAVQALARDVERVPRRGHGGARARRSTTSTR